MVKKLVLGLGLAVLAIAGPVVAWQLADGDRRAGAFSEKDTVFRSPNEQYVLAVGDEGIVLQGPSGSVELREDGVLVKSGESFVHVKPKAIEGQSAGLMSLLTASSFEVNVGSDFSSSIGGNFSETVSGSQTSSVGSTSSQTVGQDATLNIGGNFSTTVAKSVTETVSVNQTTQVGAGHVLRSSGAMSLRGATLRFNCASGSGQSVGRAGDPVQVPGPNGVILQGSPTVFAC